MVVLRIILLKRRRRAIGVLFTTPSPATIATRAYRENIHLNPSSRNLVVHKSAMQHATVRRRLSMRKQIK